MISELKIRCLTPEEIALATGGKIVSSTNKMLFISSICTDSNEAHDNSLFCAIIGERTDGHKYIESAVKNGASCILAQRVSDTEIKSDSFCYVIVEDTVKALAKLAEWYRNFIDAKIVAVTGSVGKTTTKEFIAKVLAEKYRVEKSEGNHNNEIGMPLTILGISSGVEYAVIEMGMSAIGEIHTMTEIAKPDIAVITNIGTSHIEILGNRENICRAKMEIVDGLKKGGILIISADEPLLMEAVKNRPELNVVTVGLTSEDADYKIININPSESGSLCDLVCGSNYSTTINVPVIGGHNVYDAVIAYVIGEKLGVSHFQIQSGISKFVRVGLRQKIYKKDGITIIADCYNASPESVREAIDVLKIYVSTNGGTPCALLGDMLELGDESILYHSQVGKYIASHGVNKLFCFGEKAENIAEEAINCGIKPSNVFVIIDANEHEKMADIIKENIVGGDVLLAKGSRGMKLEKILELL